MTKLALMESLVAVRRWWREKTVGFSEIKSSPAEEAVETSKTAVPSTPEEIILETIRTKGKAQRHGFELRVL